MASVLSSPGLSVTYAMKFNKMATNLHSDNPLCRQCSWFHQDNFI